MRNQPGGQFGGGENRSAQKSQPQWVGFFTKAELFLGGILTSVCRSSGSSWRCSRGRSRIRCRNWCNWRGMRFLSSIVKLVDLLTKLFEFEIEYTESFLNTLNLNNADNI